MSLLIYLFYKYLPSMYFIPDTVLRMKTKMHIEDIWSPVLRSSQSTSREYFSRRKNAIINVYVRCEGDEEEVNST